MSTAAVPATHPTFSLKLRGVFHSSGLGFIQKLPSPCNVAITNLQSKQHDAPSHPTSSSSAHPTGFHPLPLNQETAAHHPFLERSAGRHRARSYQPGWW